LQFPIQNAVVLNAVSVFLKSTGVIRNQRQNAPAGF
jgi:hypothetical protein